MIKEIIFKNNEGIETAISRGIKSGKEISWQYNTEIIRKRIVNHKGCLVACILPDRKGVFLIGQLEECDEVEAAIFNEDGSLKMTLAPPFLISEVYTNYIKTIKSKVRGGFIQPFLRQDNKGNEVLTVWIGFGPWYEERVLDPETGDFGECLGSGRL